MNKFHRIHAAMGGRRFGISLPLFLVAALFGLLLLNSPGNSQDAKAPAPQAAKPEAAPPQPEKILKEACDLLKSAKQFSFKAEVTDDRVYSGGKKLQFAFDLQASVQRPDKLRINAVGDVENKEFFLNGKTLTLYDKPHNVYATLEVPDTIDGALNKASHEYGLHVALADLASEDAYALATKGSQHALYVGQGMVQGVKCHHLAFDRNKIQWQIWIDAGDKPIIRKLLITQKKMPAEPQWTAYLADWNFAPQFADNLFVFTPPSGAKEIKFMSLKQLAAQEKKKAPAAKKKKKVKGEQS